MNSRDGEEGQVLLKLSTLTMHCNGECSESKNDQFCEELFNSIRNRSEEVKSFHLNEKVKVVHSISRNV